MVGSLRVRSVGLLIAAAVVAALLVVLPSSVLGAGDGVRSVSAGDEHACALHTDGTVSCWGKDLSGQLGDGTTGEGPNHVRLTPVKVQQSGSDMTGVKAISAGGAHTCALKTDGTVWCWGFALFGQMGNGTTGDGLKQLVPVKVQQGGGDLAGITSISAGAIHTCARRDDSTAWCWGHDDRGQLGDGTTGAGPNRVRLTAVQVRKGTGFLMNVTRVSAGDQHSCARRSDGTAWCWGDDSSGEIGDGTFGDAAHGARLKAVQVRKGGGFLTDVKAVSAGGGFSCAWTKDRTAWCWGGAGLGQVGDGTTGNAGGNRKKAVQVRRGSGFLTNVTAIDPGSRHSCARRSDATMWCWGRDEEGELGDGTTGNADHVRLKAVRVVHGSGHLTNVAAISAGTHFSCAVRSDGNAWCWGRNELGQLGIGTADTNLHTEPERVVFP